MPAVTRLAPWAALGLLALGLAAGRHALRTSRDGLDGLLYNADYLSPAALYQDLVVDGYPLAGYQFSAATFAVPDQAAYFAARAACGSHAVAMPVWVAGLFLLLTAAGVWAGCELLPDRRRAVTTTVLGGAACYLAGNAAAGFVHPHNDLLLPVWHTGALTVTLVGLAATARLARGRRVWAWSPLLAAVTAAGLFSDRFVGLYFAAPAAAGVAAWWLGGRLTGRRLVVWHVAVAGGGLAGLLALRAFQGPGDPIGNYWRPPDPSRLAERATLLAAVVGRELAGGNPLLLGAAAWYARCGVAAARWAIRPTSPAAIGFVAVVSATSLATVTGAFLLSPAADEFLPALDWVVFGRYFVGPVGLAHLGWAVRLAGTPLGLLPAAGAVAALGWVAAAPPAAGRPALDFYPEQVRAVDEACRARGLTLGLGGYGDGKPCTLLSRAGVTVRQVRPDPGAAAGAVSFPWLGNAGWSTRAPGGGPARFQFVLVGDRPGRDAALAEQPVVARLGEPAERVPVGERVLLVYDRPADWRLARFGELDGPTRNRAFGRAGAAVTYPGAALHAPAGVRVTDTADLSRVADDVHTAAGVVAHGPYLAVGRPGAHRATFRLTAAGDTGLLGYVDVVWARAADGRSGVLAAAEVRSGAGEQELPLDFRLGEEHAGGWLEFRLTFAGRGRVALHDVRFERRSHRGG